MTHPLLVLPIYHPRKPSHPRFTWKPPPQISTHNVLPLSQFSSNPSVLPFPWKPLPSIAPLQGTPYSRPPSLLPHLLHPNLSVLYHRPVFLTLIPPTWPSPPPVLLTLPRWSQCPAKCHTCTLQWSYPHPWVMYASQWQRPTLLTCLIQCHWITRKSAVTLWHLFHCLLERSTIPSHLMLLGIHLLLHWMTVHRAPREGSQIKVQSFVPM